MPNQKTIKRFRLDIRKSGQFPQKMSVLSVVNVGRDPRNDIILVGKKCLAHHLIFELKGENLSLTNLAPYNQTFLNSTSLEPNKSYLLELGDHIQINEMEIIILEDESSANGEVREEILFEEEFDDSFESPPPIPHNVFSEVDLPFSKKINFPSIESLNPNDNGESKDENNDEDNVESETTAQPKANSPADNISKISMAAEPKKKKFHFKIWVTRLYALLTDFFITFFIIAFLIPKIDHYDFFFPIHHGFLRVISPYLPVKVHPFFISFYVLRLVQLIIFGSTLGQFLVGLKFSSQKSIIRMLGLRLKIVFLGLFLIPAQNSVSSHFFFSSLRKVGLILCFGFINFSPYLLPSPTIDDHPGPQKIMAQDIQTQTHVSYAEKEGLYLALEIPKKFVLFPYAKAHSQVMDIGFELVDLKENKSLLILSGAEINYQNIFERLVYFNPTFLINHPTHMVDLSLVQKKELLTKILLSSIAQVKNNLTEFGLFYGGEILVKNYLLSTFKLKDDLVLKSTSNDDPFLLLENNFTAMTLVLTKDKIISFVMKKNKETTHLVEFANQQIMNRWHQGLRNKENQTLDILEIFDALKREDEQTTLTYYINEAKKAQEIKLLYRDEDLSINYKKALLSNIESIQSVMKNRNSKTSLEDIKHQLIPMENPGESQ